LNDPSLFASTDTTWKFFDPLRGNNPTFIRVTSGDMHDVNLLDGIMPEALQAIDVEANFADRAQGRARNKVERAPVVLGLTI